MNYAQGGRIEGVRQEPYQGGLLGPQHQDWTRSQMAWGLDYIDFRYGTRRARARRHLRAAWRELRAAAREIRR